MAIWIQRTHSGSNGWKSLIATVGPIHHIRRAAAKSPMVMSTQRLKMSPRLARANPITASLGARRSALPTCLPQARRA